MRAKISLQHYSKNVIIINRLRPTVFDR